MHNPYTHILNICKTSILPYFINSMFFIASRAQGIFHIYFLFFLRATALIDKSSEWRVPSAMHDICFIYIWAYTVNTLQLSVGVRVGYALKSIGHV